ncbi:hypothetical protein [Tahibacter caeni]|uniref:hypothetical protein n=1 Tax=Tahibacter caeni TaxID=1453545 RepID=UPI0021482CCB|nr:hypothetical protein [Tahibacter caeni]
MPRALVLLIVAVWLVLIACFVELSPFQSPWPRQRQHIDGAEFAAFSGAQTDGSALAVPAADADGGALLVRSVDITDAADWPVLRYRFAALAPTLELAFVYRRADSPRDVRTIPLTRARGSVGSVDLSREQEWRGAISEIGFAVYPVTQSVPAARAFHPFRLESAELWSPSWAGRLAAVATEWSGRRSWSLMSISALGPDSGAVRTRSPVLLLALGLGLTAVLLLQFAPQQPRRNLKILAVAAAVAWLLLDLRWSLNLADRHAATRLAYAGLDWPERQRQLPDADLLDAAERVRATLREAGADPDRVRLLVDAESDFVRARLIYHLAPTRTGPVNLVGWGGANFLSEPVYVATYAQEAPRYDAEQGLLQIDSELSLPAQALLDAPPLHLYRLGHEAAP